VADKNTIVPIKSQISLILRANWSNPPAHGARIVEMILNDPNYRQQWMDSIKMMASRIREMRKALREHLEKLSTPGSWNHSESVLKLMINMLILVTEQIGMFSYTGLTRKLFFDSHVYSHFFSTASRSFSQDAQSFLALGWTC
jgi:aspartate aminotransferase